MIGDNGDKLKSKTEEELAAERLKRYEADPYSFIDVNEIIVCVIRTSEGPCIRIKGAKSELQIAWATINQHIMSTISMMDMQDKMNKPKIHKAHKIMDFVRGGKKH